MIINFSSVLYSHYDFLIKLLVFDCLIVSTNLDKIISIKYVSQFRKDKYETVTTTNSNQRFSLTVYKRFDIIRYILFYHTHHHVRSLMESAEITKCNMQRSLQIWLVILTLITHRTKASCEKSWYFSQIIPDRSVYFV